MNNNVNLTSSTVLNTDDIINNWINMKVKSDPYNYPGNYGFKYNTEENDPQYCYTISNIDIVPSTDVVNVTPIYQTGAYKTITNDSPVAAESTQTFHYTTTETDTNAVTTGLKSTTAISKKKTIGIKVLDNSVSTETNKSETIEVNFSDTATHTNTTTQTWDDATKVTIPPYYQSTCVQTIAIADFTVPVHLVCDITGLIVVYTSQSKNSSEDTNLGQMIQDLGGVSGFTVSTISGASSGVNKLAHFDGNLNWESAGGLYSTVTITSTPLPGFPGETFSYNVPGSSTDESGVVIPSGLDIPIFNPL